MSTPAESGILHLPGQILFQGYGLGISHPDEDHSLPFGGGVVPDPHLGSEWRFRALYQAGDALTGIVKHVPVVRASDGPFKVAVTTGEAGAPVRAPVREGGDFTILAIEQDELFTQHLQVDGSPSDILFPDARIPILTEP